MKTLVVYYTRTRNAKFAAETIAAEIGADVEEVIDLKNRNGRLAFCQMEGTLCKEKKPRLNRQKELQLTMTS